MGKLKMSALYNRSGGADGGHERDINNNITEKENTVGYFI